MRVAESGGGGTLSVEVESLLDASARLEAMRATMEEIASRRGLADSIDAGTAGGVESADAIVSFLHRWSYGMSCLRSDLSSLAIALRKAADEYEKVEAEIVAATGG